jgi:nucleotide sugar dehydrogenase
MAIAVASAANEHGDPRFSVVGLDLPTDAGRERIEHLRCGRFPFATSDPALARAAAATHRAGNLTATSDPSVLATADIVVVDVPLDVQDQSGRPTVDLAPFRAAIGTIAAHVQPGALVIVETTVPPGTCERVVAPQLRAGLRDRGLPEDAVLLAHSYERVMPGEDYLASITHFWRVYAGHTVDAADACERFLSQVIAVAEYPLTRLASTTASETAKVLENSYRAVNIALIEEWGRFAEAVGFDLFEVLAAIRRRPTHANIRQPGFGVGGYCLTKDPLFVGIAARELFDRSELSFPFAEMAVAVNARMPLVTVERLQALLHGSLRGKRVLLLGASYREGVADTRYSPSETFVRELCRRGADVQVHDPLVTEWPELGMQLPAELPGAAGFDAVVLAVAHRAYRTLDLASWLGAARPVILDANGVLTAEQRRSVMAVGGTVHSIGSGAETPWTKS